MHLTADYGRGGVKSPFNLLMANGKFTQSDGPGSLQHLMRQHGCTDLCPDRVHLTPEKWRKEGYVRAGRPGHQGPYDAEPQSQKRGRTPAHWWQRDGSTATRSTPNQDMKRRKHHSARR